MEDDKSISHEPATLRAQRLGFNRLLDEAKKKGYLNYDDFARLLPNDSIEPAQLQRFIHRLNERGIIVYEALSNTDSLLVEEAKQAEEMNDDAATVYQPRNGF